MQSPENNRINNRRKKLREIWKSPEWKKGVKAFVNGKCCEWCGGTEKLTAHHPYYSSGEVYLDLYLSGCMILCNRCHFAIHHNLTLCPSCRVKYCRNGSSVCYNCYLRDNPGIAEKIERAKDEMKRKKKEADKKYRQSIKDKVLGKVDSRNKHPDNNS